MRACNSRDSFRPSPRTRRAANCTPEQAKATARNSTDVGITKGNLDPRIIDEEDKGTSKLSDRRWTSARISFSYTVSERNISAVINYIRLAVLNDREIAGIQIRYLTTVFVGNDSVNLHEVKVNSNDVVFVDWLRWCRRRLWRLRLGQGRVVQQQDNRNQSYFLNHVAQSFLCLLCLFAASLATLLQQLCY
jgi:hypothetical protein